MSLFALKLKACDLFEKIEDAPFMNNEVGAYGNQKNLPIIKRRMFLSRCVDIAG